MTITTHSISLKDRGTFEYAVRGQGEQTVMMLHGYLDSWYSFAGVMLALPESLRCVSLSQRGHGESEKPADGYMIDDFANDAVALIEALDLGPVILVGHSMGSFIAQHVAVQRPDLVKQLVLIGSGMSADTGLLNGLHGETLLMRDPISREFSSEFQAGTCANPVGPGMDFTRIVDETMKVPARVWQRALKGLIDYRPQAGTPERLPINCPTLVIWGDKDEIFVASAQADLIAAIPGAKLEILAGAGHAVHWEFPVACAKLISLALAPNTGTPTT